MRSIACTAVAFFGLSTLLASAAPLDTRNAAGAFPGGNVFPLANGFPSPSPDAVQQIEVAAHGTLPNGPPPPSLSAEGITNLKLIAFNELFEVAFFTELIFNITNHVPGYVFHDHTRRQFILDSLNAIVAQEELHTLNANGALAHFGAAPILPCKYSFPVTNFDDAIGLAGTFTSVVLGTLQEVTRIFAQNGDAGLTQGVASVIGQEGEQEGWYRILQGKIPSELPFLTTGVRDFAFTAIQSFTVPGSCPNVGTIPLKTFLPLNLLSKPAPATMTLKFSWPLPPNPNPNAQISIAYINQQNTPIVEPLTNVSVQGATVFAEALFPYNKDELNGLTIAAVVNGAGPFASADAVAAATIFGPAFIVVN